MPCVAFVEVDLDEFANLPVKLCAFDQQTHLGIQPKRACVQISTSDEGDCIVHDQEFCMQAEVFFVNRRLHVDVPILGEGPDFVNVGTVADQSVDVFAIRAVGREVIV